MTTPDPETMSPAEDYDPFEESPLYHVSFDRLVELRRSAVALVAERRVPACPSLMTPPHELDDPQALIDEIAEFCGDDRDFIHNNMAIQEIVFRTLLANANQPMTLEALHYELTERWSTPVRPINISEAGLERVLEADDYYGFAKAQGED